MRNSRVRPFLPDVPEAAEQLHCVRRASDLPKRASQRYVGMQGGLRKPAEILVRDAGGLPAASLESGSTRARRREHGNCALSMTADQILRTD